ncbi:hypothetical protein VitviT2T_022808 [Vitis vinifera]|uniref:DUF632 domain-containing protein n=1 Tax=Vitis vinifera TaxID=29760 RepID=A0ABY9DAZ3_VITVI|nr:hypothetical protein VitviT2T_022808 [Vitis vinifera]
MATTDSTRKIYKRKCSQLRNKDVRGDDELYVDKTKATVKDLYARILVAIRPQIMELLKGLMQTWKIMLESHQTQNQILFEVKSLTFAPQAPLMATFGMDPKYHIHFFN